MESEGLQQVRQKSFLALKALAHDNPVIQNRLYDRMFELLNVQGADKELAMALVEVPNILCKGKNPNSVLINRTQPSPTKWVC